MREVRKATCFLPERTAWFRGLPQVSMRRLFRRIRRIFEDMKVKTERFRDEKESRKEMSCLPMKTYRGQICLLCIWEIWTDSWRGLIRREMSVLFVLICVVLACFAVSYYVTCSISDPIRQLIKVMDKAGKGKVDGALSNQWK